MATGAQDAPKRDMSKEHKLTAEERQHLIEAACKARERAYAPYSHFSVGAAVLTSKGSMFTGVNVENASYGLTICAERVAVFKAISEGHRRFTRIAVVADTSDPTARVPTPTKRSPRNPSRVAQSPEVRAASPAASPEAVRTWPAVATETPRSRATSGSSGFRTTSAACEAASAVMRAMPTARGPSRITR